MLLLAAAERPPQVKPLQPMAAVGPRPPARWQPQVLPGPRRPNLPARLDPLRARQVRVVLPVLVRQLARLQLPAARRQIRLRVRAGSPALQG